MKDFRRLRNFLDIRQADLASGTGISTARISAAENRRIKLTDSELRAIEEFLRARARVVLGRAELPE